MIINDSLKWTCLNIEIPINKTFCHSFELNRNKTHLTRSSHLRPRTFLHTRRKGEPAVERAFCAMLLSMAVIPCDTIAMLLWRKVCTYCIA